MISRKMRTVFFDKPFLAVAAALCFLGQSATTGRAAELPVTSPWTKEIVNIEVARKQYDYYQPWSRRTHLTQKTGLIVSDHEILTTADELFDRTLIRLQKNGRGRWWLGDLAWIDYHANLALITNSEPEFWKDLQPITFAKAPTPDLALSILRWREGKLENRRAELTQFSVREAQLSPINMAVIETSSDIQGIGWGEPLVSQGKVLGIITSQDNRNCTAMPASFIQSILEARNRKGGYPGLGYFPFYWQPAENPASLDRLALKGDPRGVIITDVPPRADGKDGVVKAEDILLSIDGFPLDVQGDYIDPEFGPLMLENLAVRGKWAGDALKMQLWRNGKQIEVKYTLPKFQYTNALVPAATYDKEPEYLMTGGFVFQPLTDSYLQAWGTDWKRRAPFRLNHYREEEPTPDRPALVLLSQVMPDAYNIGYQDLKYLVLSKVNGQPVHSLKELRNALAQPQKDYNVLEFQKGDALKRVVLAAGDPEKAATARILKRYSMPETYHFNNE